MQAGDIEGLGIPIRKEAPSGESDRPEAFQAGDALTLDPLKEEASNVLLGEVRDLQKYTSASPRASPLDPYNRQNCLPEYRGRGARARGVGQGSNAWQKFVWPAQILGKSCEMCISPYCEARLPPGNISLFAQESSLAELFSGFSPRATTLRQDQDNVAVLPATLRRTSEGGNYPMPYLLKFFLKLLSMRSQLQRCSSPRIRWHSRDRNKVRYWESGYKDCFYNVVNQTW